MLSRLEIGKQFFLKRIGPITREHIDKIVHASNIESKGQGGFSGVNNYLLRVCESIRPDNRFLTRLVLHPEATLGMIHIAHSHYGPNQSSDFYKKLEKYVEISDGLILNLAWRHFLKNFMAEGHFPEIKDEINTRPFPALLSDPQYGYSTFIRLIIKGSIRMPYPEFDSKNDINRMFGIDFECIYNQFGNPEISDDALIRLMQSFIVKFDKNKMESNNLEELYARCCNLYFQYSLKNREDNVVNWPNRFNLGGDNPVENIMVIVFGLSHDFSYAINRWNNHSSQKMSLLTILNVEAAMEAIATSISINS